MPWRPGPAWPSGVSDVDMVRAFRRECGIVHAILTGLVRPVRPSLQREAASGADCHGVIAMLHLYETPSISCDWHHMFGVQHQAVPLFR